VGDARLRQGYGGHPPERARRQRREGGMERATGIEPFERVFLIH